MLDFYERLFDPATVRHEEVAGDAGLRSGRMLLLFRNGRFGAEQDTAIWHVGWGNTVLGDTYLAHASRDVAWEPPLPAEQIHLHLLSEDPLKAAGWYRDRLDASVEVMPTLAKQIEPRPELRVADAIVRFGPFALVIYRAAPPFASTRGQRIDHFALSGDELDSTLTRLRAASVRVLVPPAPFINAARAAIIEGPDGVAIELIERRN